METGIAYMVGIKGEKNADLVICYVGGDRNIEGSSLDEIKKRYVELKFEKGVSIDTQKHISCLTYPWKYIDENYDLEPGQIKASEKRLAFIGDSFTYGQGVPRENSFPEITQGLLDEKHENWRVFNISRPGLDFPDTYEYFRKTLEISPDIIIYVWFINDIPKLGRVEKGPVITNDYVTLTDPVHFLKGPNLVKLVRSSYLKWQASRKTVKWYHDIYSKRNATGVNSFRTYLENMKKEASRQSAEFGVVLFPVLVGSPGRYLFRREHDIVRMILNDVSIPYLDLTEHLLSGHTPDLWVHELDHHPNSKAHRIAAASVFEFLESNFQMGQQQETPNSL